MIAKRQRRQLASQSQWHRYNMIYTMLHTHPREHSSIAKENLDPHSLLENMVDNASTQNDEGVCCIIFSTATIT